MVRISVELPDEVAEALGRIAQARDTTLEALLVGVITVRVAAYVGESTTEVQTVAAPGLNDTPFNIGPSS